MPAYFNEVYLVKKMTSYISVSVDSQYTSCASYPPLPTPEEANDVMGESGTPVRYGNTFGDCINMKAGPRIPDGAEQFSDVFSGSGLVIPPSIPVSSSNSTYIFENCASLIQPSVIAKGISNLSHWFDGCGSLQYGPSIPASVNSLYYTFRNCTNMTGEMIIRPSSISSRTQAFRGTTKPITLYGDQSLCESLAATSTNSNVSWSDWYDPVPAVANRGQGSFTTAADMTRMVRNGALAVNTYAPGRMVYSQGDIVREDEWKALVEAAQTIDPTVTYSTHYANLNKIEAAFDSAL